MKLNEFLVQKIYIVLRVLIYSYLIFSSCPYANGTKVFKPSRIINKNTSYRYGTDIIITDLIYDDNGNLVRFIEYYEGSEDRPRFDILLQWDDNHVNVYGIIDYHPIEGIIELNENGLVSHVSIFETDGKDYEDFEMSNIVYDNNNILQFDVEYGRIDFQYVNEELNGIYKNNSIIIDFRYDNVENICNISFPGIWANCLFYHRYIVYAGLMGQPLNHLPSSYNRYNRGWRSLNYSYDSNGNVSKIESEGGLTHASFDFQEYIYEYTLTNSIDKINNDKLVIKTEGKSIVIQGKRINQWVILYNINGQMLKSTIENRIEVQERGFYLLKIDNNIYKIVL